MTAILAKPHSSKAGKLLHAYKPQSVELRFIYWLVTIAVAILLFVLCGDDYSVGIMHFPVWPALCFFFSLAAIAQTLQLFTQEDAVQVFEHGIAVANKFMLWSELKEVEFCSLHIEGSVHTGQPKQDLYYWTLKAKDGSIKNLKCKHGPGEYIPEDELNHLLSERGLLRRH